MTLCPYKWFLYMASVWALVYLAIQGMMELQKARKPLRSGVAPDKGALLPDGGECALGSTSDSDSDDE